MKTKLWGIFILTIMSMLYLTACDNSTSPGIEDSLELYTGLEVIPEASQTTLTINKGNDQLNDGYFQIKIADAKPNQFIQNIQTEAWCLEWKKPLRTNNDIHSNVKWYSTETNSKWKPLNYFFSIKRELQKNDPELTNREIQAVIWTIAGYMNIAPEFDVDKLSDSELPNRLRSNGVANFDKDKVRTIISKVLSEYSTATGPIPFSFVAETSHDEQDVVVPPPPPPVIDIDTEIFIYFDNSGSMGSTLRPLRTMRDELLKEALLPLYDNDSDAYDENVTITENWFDERTFNVLNLQGAAPPEGNVIVLVFQDEAHDAYHDRDASWSVNSTRTFKYNTDISAFRTRLESFASDYYRGVIFQVTNTDFSGNESIFGINFRTLIQAVESGDGNYDAANGLSDRTEIEYVYNVNDGDDAQVYTDLVIDALEGFGFDLTPPTVL